MNFNIYDDSFFRKMPSRFSSLTKFVFKTFVVVPCVTFFFLFSLLAYSSGGVGNIITEYIKSVGYSTDTDSYQVCLDEPPATISKQKKEPPPALNIYQVCKKHGYVSSAKKSSLLTGKITGWYLSIVSFYIFMLLGIRCFKMKKW